MANKPQEAITTHRQMLQCVWRPTFLFISFIQLQLEDCGVGGERRVGGECKGGA